ASILQQTADYIRFLEEEKNILIKRNNQLEAYIKMNNNSTNTNINTSTNNVSSSLLLSQAVRTTLIPNVMPATPLRISLPASGNLTSPHSSLNTSLSNTSLNNSLTPPPTLKVLNNAPAIKNSGIPKLVLNANNLSESAKLLIGNINNGNNNVCIANIDKSEQLGIKKRKFGSLSDDKEVVVSPANLSTLDTISLDKNFVSIKTRSNISIKQTGKTDDESSTSPPVISPSALPEPTRQLSGAKSPDAALFRKKFKMLGPVFKNFAPQAPLSASSPSSASTPLLVLPRTHSFIVSSTCSSAPTGTDLKTFTAFSQNTSIPGNSAIYKLGVETIKLDSTIYKTFSNDSSEIKSNISAILRVSEVVDLINSGLKYSNTLDHKKDLIKIETKLTEGAVKEFGAADNKDLKFNLIRTTGSSPFIQILNNSLTSGSGLELPPTLILNSTNAKKIVINNENKIVINHGHSSLISEGKIVVNHAGNGKSPTEAKIICLSSTPLSGSSTRPSCSMDEGRRNLQTIVEAIKHLEGENLFSLSSASHTLGSPLSPGVTPESGEADSSTQTAPTFIFPPLEGDDDDDETEKEGREAVQDKEITRVEESDEITGFLET
ncbi:unnamed protein product, partial [Gordionus sp. m RMFG-2023]